MPPRLSRRVASASTIVAAIACMTACGSAPSAGLGRSDGMAAPSPVAGVTGYLNSGPYGIAFLQWQTDGGGDLQGTIDMATVSGTAPNESVSTASSSFSGQISGSSVTLNIGGHTDYGTVTDGTLTLNVRQTDGRIQPVVYRRASPADYNKALAAVNRTVQQANITAGRQQQNQQDASSLSDDLTGIGDDESSLKSDLSSMGDDVSSTSNDLAATRSDELKVLTEAHNGTDNATVCTDADGVSTDADGVSTDADGLSTDLNSLTSDLSSLRNHISSANSNLATVQKEQPGYDSSQGQQTISGARSLIAQVIAETNADINKENGYVTAAFQHATAADSAGNCGSSSSPPSPIDHIS